MLLNLYNFHLLLIQIRHNDTFLLHSSVSHSVKVFLAV